MMRDYFEEGDLISVYIGGSWIYPVVLIFFCIIMASSFLSVRDNITR